MEGVLNEVTNTIHKQETGTMSMQTICGVTYHTPQENLRQITSIDPALKTANANKCGRCFDDGGGY